jgi:protein TonB
MPAETSPAPRFPPDSGLHPFDLTGSAFASPVVSSMANGVLPEVFTVRDVARATGASERSIQALVDAGMVSTLPVGGRRTYLDYDEAIRVGRALVHGENLLETADSAAMLFRKTLERPRPRVPFAISTVAHIGAVSTIVLATLAMGAAAPQTSLAARSQPAHLVYLTLPGPGGGGGGGGEKKPQPAPRAKRQGKRALSSPIPSRPLPANPPPQAPVPRPPEQPVQAPVVEVPADPADRPGVVEDVPAPEESRGPGAEGIAGAGTNGGMGDGDGEGIGPGEDEGTGGGPYRPGSGIEPPSVLREVKPLYTEAARQRALQGDVLLEIVVRRDGSVGDVRIVKRLGHGLDQRAVDAVRQWRFNPARRHGTAVDVLVEVAMEFRLR